MEHGVQGYVDHCLLITGTACSNVSLISTITPCLSEQRRLHVDVLPRNSAAILDSRAKPLE